MRHAHGHRFPWLRSSGHGLQHPLKLVVSGSASVSIAYQIGFLDVPEANTGNDINVNLLPDRLYFRVAR